MIRIFIADDSAFMRKILSDLFMSQPDFNVLGTARNGKEAVEKIRILKPDLITMDVNMPVMDGISALEAIMKEMPTPVVMVSSLTKNGAEATVRALSLGAVDFIEKMSGPIPKIELIKTVILDKCRAAVCANVQKKISPIVKKPPVFQSVEPKRIGSAGFGSVPEKIIAIGTSTGGPRALQHVITKLPRSLPCGVVIVQHMPPGFTRSLAERLNSLSEVAVKEAEDNDIVGPGKVFIAPGNYHITVQQQGDKRVIKLNQDPPLASHRPAVDVLFDSVAKFGNKVVAAIFTGMGSDGAKGMKKIKENGGFSIAENESTAVVYGMPKAVVDLGLADQVLPIEKIADALVQAVKR